MTSCLMSSIKELLVLRIDGAIEALEEPYRESLPKLFMLGLWESTAGDGFSVIAVGTCGEGVEAAGVLGLPAFK